MVSPRTWRRLAAFALLVGLMALPQTAGAGSATDDEEPGVGGVQRFGSCLAAGGKGSLLLLMDTSASLKTTDPEAQRVEAARYLLTELSTFAETTDASIEVAVAGFADTFEVSQEWTDLDKQSTGQVLDAVTDYTDRDNGWETDYWMGLNGARRHLSDRIDEGDCAALVWLSDGMYDLDTRDTEAERSNYGVTKPYGPKTDLTNRDAEARFEQAGEKDICRAGGVADAVRVEGIVTLAIGLSDAQDDVDFDLMSGIATGKRGGGDKCGERPAEGLGDFVLAQQVGDLFFAFDELSNPNNAPISGTTPLCQGSPCEQGTHQFVLDASISSVQVLGGTGLDEYEAQLISPQGERIQLVQGSDLEERTGSADIEGRWVSSSVFSLTMDRKADEGWTGVWRLVFIDPNSTGSGTARSNIRLYGDLRPAWVDSGDDQLVAGGEPDIHLGLARVDGTEVAPESLAGNARLDATLELSDGSSQEIATGLTKKNLTEPVALDLTSVATGPAKVRLVLVLTTAAAGRTPGTTLEPQAVEYPVTIAPPPSYPRVSATLDFGSSDSKGPVVAKLGIEGDGCVWLDGYEALTFPEGVESTVISSKSASQDACATGDLTVELTPDAVGTGLASGTLRVLTAPDSSGDPVPVTVKYTYEMERPADATVRWVVFGLLLFAGLLIPLLILAFIKWRTATIPGSGVALYVVSGHVDEGTSFLTQHRADTTKIERRSLEGGNRRRLVISPRTTLRTRANLRGIAAPGHVRVLGAQAVYSQGDHAPLAVQDTWVAVLDPQDPANGPVEVVILMESAARSLEQLLADAREKLPAKVARLRSKLNADPTPSVQDDGWGASPSRSGQTPTAPSDDW